MKVNGEYVYDDNGTLRNTSSDTDKDEKAHLWNTIGNDPYAIQIRNVGTPTRFFTHNTAAGTLTLGGDGTNTYTATKTAKMLEGKYYEVEVALE